MQLQRHTARFVSSLLLAASALANAAPELLDPDVAFQVKLLQKDRQTVTARFQSAKDYHLYKDKMHFVLARSPGVSIQSIRFPKGIVQTDPNFGSVEMFKDTVDVEIAIQRAAGAKQVTVVADYQGCEEKVGVCYQPMRKEMTLALQQ